MENCVFCEIAAGRAPAEILCQEEGALAFLDAHPAALGHTLVVPRRHCVTLWELDEESAAAVARLLVRISRALRQALAPDGLTVLQNNGRAAGQEVLHAHFHLIPRWYGDGLRLGRGLPMRPAEPLAEVAQRVRKVLA